MANLIRFHEKHIPVFSNNWRKFLFWGITLVILGMVAIYAAAFTTLLSIIFLGVLITLSGIVIAMDTISVGWGKWSGYLIHLIIAILYIAIGITLITYPVLGSISLTLLLGVFYIFMGITRLLFSSMLRIPQWGWNGFNGFITLLIGICILISWPQSSLLIIGLFVGIDLLFIGWAYIMSAMAARKLIV